MPDNKEKALPDLPLIDAPPAAGFERVCFSAAERDLEEVQVGGLWFDPAEPNVIWKALDSISLESEALKLMAGAPGFLARHKWAMREANGRAWLMLKRPYIVGVDYDPSWLDRPAVLLIEQGLRLLNARGWRLGRPLLVGIEPDDYAPFLFDLSKAHKPARADASQEGDDEALFLRWAEAQGHGDLVALRRAGREIVENACRHHAAIEPGMFGWIYGSPLRPMTASQFSGHNVWCLPADTQGMMTWVLTTAALDPEIAERHSLVYAWSRTTLELNG